MQRVAKRVNKVVSALSDPDPTFVSIVTRGANQRPFKVVKADLLPETMKKNANAQKVEKGASPDVEIHKMIFSGKNFTTKAEVEHYMKEAGYSDFAVTKDDDDFVVPGIAEDQFESTSPIKKDEGVIMFVGKLTADAKAKKAAVIVNVTTSTPAAAPAQAAAKPAAAATEEPVVATEEVKPAAAKEEAAAAAPAAKPAAKTEEVRSRTRNDSFLVVKNDTLLARKIDSYCGYYGCASNCSNEVTIAGVLEDMKDGLPVGFYDVYSAFVSALKNIVLTDAIDQVPVLMTEFGSIITKLATLTASVEKSDREDTLKKLCAIPDSLVKKGEAAPAELVEGELMKSDGIAEVVAKAMEPLMAILTPLQETVTKLSGRLLNVEAIKQERKGADEAEELGAAPANEEEPTTVKTAKEDKEKNEAALKKGTNNLFLVR